MSGENVVKILVTADNASQPGFDEASAGAEEMAGKVDAAMDDYQAALDKAAAAQAEFDEAQQAQADAAARVTELQEDEADSADELAAAQDRLTASSLAAADARKALADANAEVATMTQAASDEQVEAGVKSDESAGMFAGAGSKMKMAALGVAVGLGLAVKGAADFQQQTTKLVTSAGESAKNLGMVQRGILALSSSTNTSTSQLASGMYMVESAGFHGAAGLTVLKAAAQGAQAEGADLADVANAVTSGLNAYGMKANQATAFTDEMVRAVGQGKMTMQDLASSLSAVLPIAASAHISFAQVGGAVATMTMQGMSARQATQDLASSIRELLNPNTVAVNEMNQFGISSVGVANKLGSRGLTGTISYLADTIAKQMGPSGDVILKTFNQSKVAAQDAETMLSAMPPKLKAMAQGYLDGTTSYQTWYTATKGLPPLLRNQADQFATVANSAHGFNSLLKSGQPDAQTFAAALGKMMGGATGLNTALMLTGAHTGQFNTNVKAIADSAKGAGSNVRGWSIIQGEANFQIGSAVKAVEAMGDALGLALLPTVTRVLKPLTSLLETIAKNKTEAIIFATVVGGVLAGALGAKMAGALKDMKDGLTLTADGAEKLITKLFGLGAAEDTEAAAADEAAASEGGLMAALSGLGSAVAAAASSVASFAATVVKQMAAAAVATGEWIAEHAVAAASFIAENVAMAASATAAFIAENAATLGIVAGIALLVAGIIYLATHWRQVWDVIKHIFDDAVSFIKAHLSILAEIIGTILLGPLGFLVAYIATHWNTVKHLTEDLWHDVTSIFDDLVHDISSLVSTVVDFVRSHWELLAEILATVLLGPVGFLIAFIATHWDEFKNLTSSLVDNVVHFFETLPGRIMSAIAALPGELLSFGAHIISMFAAGIRSAAGGVLSGAMHDVMSVVSDFIPHSPAKKGPLSGSGSPDLAGRRIAQMLGQGMISGLPAVSAAAGRMAGAAGIGAGHGYGAAGGSGALAIDVRLSGTDSQIVKALWPHLKLEVRALGGGGPYSAQKSLGSTWPAGA